MIGQISASNQLRTTSELASNMFGASSELASVMEFGFNSTKAFCVSECSNNTALFDLSTIATSQSGSPKPPVKSGLVPHFENLRSKVCYDASVCGGAYSCDCTAGAQKTKSFYIESHYSTSPCDRSLLCKCQIPLRYPARELVRQLVRELVQTS